MVMTEAAEGKLSQAIISLRGVEKVREKGGNRFDLSIPSFVVHPGEFIAIVGASGCGKSTLLDMLALVLRPTSADDFTLRLPTRAQPDTIMTLSDDDLASIRQADIGYVLQTGGLLPFLTVKDNIMLPCRINGLENTEQEMHTLVDRLNIGEQLTKKPQFLSGGQRQRVAIARALVHRPALVLADEPTAAVDKPTAYAIRDKFKELTQERDVTVCLVTHDHSLVEGVADRTFTFEVDKKSDTYTHSVCLEQRGSHAAHQA